MKKVLGILAMVFMAMAMSAGTVFADSNASVDDVNANASVTDVKATAINNQRQGQATDVDGGNANGNSVTADIKRDHISVQPGAAGVFVGVPPTMAPGVWYEVTCDNTLRIFTKEELELAKGGKVVESTYRQRKADKPDFAPVTRLDYVPNGPSDRFIGEFMVRGKRGQDIVSPLSKAILMAMEMGAHRVFVWALREEGAETYGLALGSGGGGAISSANTAKVLTVGATIGWSAVGPTETMMVRVKAYNDGPVDPPAGVCPCGGCEKTAPAPKMEPAPVAPTATKKCDPDAIRTQIEILKEKISKCRFFSLNNLSLRAQLGEAYVQLYKCTGDPSHLREAIKQYQIAERNYLRGSDTRQEEGKKIIAQVYRLWAGCIWQIHGRDAAMRFAKEKGLRGIPAGIAR